MTGRPRLLFIAAEFTHGGSALLLARHAQRLAPHYAIDLLLAGPVEAAALAELPEGVSVFRFRPARQRLLARLWLAQEPLAAWLRLPRRRRPFDGGHAAAFIAVGQLDWRALMVLSQLRVPRKFVFLTDNSLASYRFYRPRERAAFDCGLRSADCFLPVSAALWTELAAACPPLAGRPHRVLPPPLVATLATATDAPPPSPYPATSVPIVLTIARLMAAKNISACIRAHARLRAAGRDFRWYVVGSGPDEAAFRAEIAQHGLGDVFFLAGRQPSVAGWLQHCDVFAFFSVREGCPTVVREALAAGCPVVMTEVHGAHEMIDHGRTGFIVAHDDAAIAEGLDRLLRDPELRRSLRNTLAMHQPAAAAARETAQLIELIEAPPAAPVPHVSILIPTYNQEGFIERAIASALAQDYPDLEVIVSDDASTDTTGERARAWCGDPRFHYHRNPARLGHTGNYRRLLGEYARGDWALMLDGDDHLLDPAFIRRALAAIDAHPDRRIVFAQAGQRVLPADGDPTAAVDVLPPIAGEAQLVTGGDYLALLARGPNFFSHLGTLYDRRAALELGFYTAPISASDQDSLLRLALEGEVLLLHMVAGCWVRHEGNISDHVPLAEIGANVRVLRDAARAGARRGLVSAAALEAPLNHHEAATLAHLCGRHLAEQPPRLRMLFRIMAVIMTVNPQLLFSPALLRLHFDYVCLLLGFPPRHPLVLALHRLLRRIRSRAGS
jgi:glycosyltransferase involved in cell wall biosynthesis